MEGIWLTGTQRRFWSNSGKWTRARIPFAGTMSATMGFKKPALPSTLPYTPSGIRSRRIFSPERRHPPGAGTAGARPWGDDDDRHPRRQGSAQSPAQPARYAAAAWAINRILICGERNASALGAPRTAGVVPQECRAARNPITAPIAPPRYMVYRPFKFQPPLPRLATPYALRSLLSHAVLYKG